jgi:hypothetical protein
MYMYKTKAPIPRRKIQPSQVQVPLPSVFLIYYSPCLHDNLFKGTLTRRSLLVYDLFLIAFNEEDKILVCLEYLCL